MVWLVVFDGFVVVWLVGAGFKPAPTSVWLVERGSGCSGLAAPGPARASPASSLYEGGGWCISCVVLKGEKSCGCTLGVFVRK